MMSCFTVFAPEPPTVQLKDPSGFKRHLNANASSSQAAPVEVKVTSNKGATRGFNTPHKGTKTDKPYKGQSENTPTKSGHRTDNSKVLDKNSVRTSDVSASKGGSDTHITKDNNHQTSETDTSCDTSVKSLSLTDTSRSAIPKVSTPAKSQSRYVNIYYFD